MHILHPLLSRFVVIIGWLTPLCTKHVKIRWIIFAHACTHMHTCTHTCTHTYTHTHTHTHSHTHTQTQSRAEQVIFLLVWAEKKQQLKFIEKKIPLYPYHCTTYSVFKLHLLSSKHMTVHIIIMCCSANYFVSLKVVFLQMMNTVPDIYPGFWSMMWEKQHMQRR